MNIILLHYLCNLNALAILLLESFQMFPIFLSNKKCRLEHVANKLMSCLITEFLWIFSYKLHGILSNSMGTLWHSMELHGHAMAFHGTASVLQGTPWHSMELHDIPWNFMAFHGTPSLLHGTPWNSMAFHGTPWILHGTPWHSVELHGYSMDTPWEFRGIPWISIDFHGIPWISIDFHGIAWRYFTRD